MSSRGRKNAAKEKGSNQNSSKAHPPGGTGPASATHSPATHPPAAVPVQVQQEVPAAPMKPAVARPTERTVPEVPSNGHHTAASTSATSATPSAPSVTGSMVLPKPKADGPERVDTPTTLDISKPSTLATPGARAVPVEPVHAKAETETTVVALVRPEDSGVVLAEKPELSTLATMLAPQPAPAPNVHVERQQVEPPRPVTPPPAAAQPPAPEPGPSMSLLPPLLFECGWEVCWQLGGIYTVLRSKAATMLRTWEDRYCLIGPYNPQTAPVEFEPEEPQGPLAIVIQRLRDSGIPVHYGCWLIPGRPKTVLLDYRAMFRELDANKYLMWVDHGIDIPPNDGEVNEVVAFGFAVTEFFRQLSLVVTDRVILAHFHEWMAGVAVPRIAHLRLPVSTVFTTHATLLGRYLAGDNPEFYNHLPFLNGDAEARKYQIFPKHLIEKAAAHASTVFTTVSEVTAFEAEKLLGRRPEVILPNGINIHRFAALHEFQNLHRQYKEKIHEFVMGHFFPCYTFDLEKTIYLFTSGRYEYRNKGMDLFIEAMYRLNQRLKYVPDRPTVVAFIVTKAPIRHVNIGALQNQSMFHELKRTTTELQEEMGQRLFSAAAHGRIPKAGELLADDALVRLKRAMHAWRSGQPPAIVTHDLQDDAADPVLKHLRYRGMFNGGDDPVKMVFHPQFVTQTGPLINLDYEQFVRGCHMGIFPSYYEPWGYTPMESVALGLPAVTTDLSGFGAYVRRHIPDSHDKGICVLNRRYRTFDEACNELVDYLFDFVRLTRRQRIELRNKVERLSELFDWSALIRHYREAHDLALERSVNRYPGKIEVRMI